MKQHLAFAVAVGVAASFGLRAQDGAADPGSSDSGVKVTYMPGEGVTFTYGDKAELNFSASIQAKFYFADLDSNLGIGDQASFQARRVRTNWEGFVFNRDFTYRLQLDHTGSSSVIDAYGDWHFVTNENSYIGARLGVQKMGGSLQFASEGTALELTERSLATRTFSELRDLGLLVHGGALNGEKDGEYKLHWSLGAMNNGTAAGAAAANLVPFGVPDNSVLSRANVNVGNNLMYNAGLWFSLDGIDSPESWTEGDLAHGGSLETLFGAQYLFGENDYGQAYGAATGFAPTGMVETSQLALSAALKTGSGLAFQGEYLMRTDEPKAGGAEGDATGYYVQGSYTTAPGEDKTQYGFVGRYSWVELDPGTALSALPSAAGTQLLAPGAAGTTGEVSEIQVGVNAYYHKHNLKTQLTYTLQNLDANGAPDSDNHVFDLMFTLMF